ncbi:hypothetical protein BJ508DRAFT_304951 [Ascobolus immersus RN42]|uniref:Uncharacterized protein n=1 Tax=Ascobolus immersus RN42 TaxID=1160509 RepID=A0A3N4INQ0_ASCIM|nr:hypothetical protein BJ508DRAFT_304951 [Ascobolus immersus RN42]
MPKGRLSIDLQLLKKHQDERDYIKRNLLADALFSELQDALAHLPGRANFQTRIYYQLDIAKICDRSRNDSALIAVAIELSDDWRRFQRMWKELSSALLDENSEDAEIKKVADEVIATYPAELRRYRDELIDPNFEKLKLRARIAYGIDPELIDLMALIVEENKKYWERTLKPELERYLAARNLD